MVTPHLPPHQAANALLPHLLGQGLGERGHVVRYLTLGGGPDTATVRFVPRRGSKLRATRLPQLAEAAQTWWKLRPLLRDCDVVHVHSNTWVNQVAAGLAVQAGRPYVLTHYGTEIWHSDGRERRFRRLNQEAGAVAFYSRALLERGHELGLPLPGAVVIYPPVADEFRPVQPSRRAELRRRAAGDAGLVLLNVKRLHPLADQITLLDAMAAVARERRDVVLLVAGAGAEERRLRDHAGRLDLGGRVRFLGPVPNAEVAELQAAADLFVLSSLLEATPTVALEALACGTPVISTDSPGGLELEQLFGTDVTIVPKRDPGALARSILEFAATPRRASPESTRLVEERFRLPGVIDRYLGLYEAAAA